MKKPVLFFAVMSFVLALVCVSCNNSAGGGGSDSAASAPSSGGTGGTNEGAQTGGTGGVTVNEDGTVTISSSKMVYIGEGSETVDGVEYNAKKYAQLVIDDNPYFYTYYKLYFLNGKLRRLWMFDHGIGCAMDYKYDEFVEHTCDWERSARPKIYGYHENGKLAYYIYSEDKWEYENYVGTQHKVLRHEYYLNEDGNTASLNEYVDDIFVEKQEWEYYTSGKIKTNKRYYLSEGTLYLSTVTTYYENGKIKSNETYNGSLTRKITNYESGNFKISENYSSGIKTSLIMYYDEKDDDKCRKVEASFDSTTGKLTYFSSFYHALYNHYYKCYYSSGFFYTYENNKIKFAGRTTELTSLIDSSVYSTKEDCTQEQAEAKLAELMNE